MNMNTNSLKFFAGISLAVFFGAGSAMAEDSTVVERQQGMIQTLDSLNSSVMGLRLGGTAKSGVLSSTASSDQLANKADEHRETQAYTDVNLVVTARPSSETEARVELRLHRDWQSAYDESWNPVLGHWFSYDGKILDKHVDFNLGYMRVAYTPLTLYVPQTEILQEPDIFVQKRIDALAMRSLDTSSNRLLQGINARYNSFEIGPLSNIYLQLTGARLRSAAKKSDQVFFDFDWSDRYLAGANAGVEAYGFTLGGNFVTSFDRRKSSEAANVNSELFYEDNRVWSGILAFDSKELLGGDINFGVNGEVARSRWGYENRFKISDTTHSYYLKPFYKPQFDENGAIYETVEVQGESQLVQVCDTSFYVVDSFTVGTDWETKEIDKRKGLAISVTPFVRGEISKFDFNVAGTFTKNDEEFWSEQASSNYYVGNTSILNGDASYSGVDENVLERFRSGSLENMYFALYNTNVLQQQNLMSKRDAAQLTPGQSESNYTYGRLFNNYKLGHFYKNAYQAYAYKYMELASEAAFLDPSVNMAMPLGLATPDRMGFSLSGDVGFADAVALNLRFAKYSQDAIDNDFTQMGGGLMVELGTLLGMDRRIKLQGSFEKGEESDYLKRETSRAVGGATIDVWGPIALLGGVQLLNKKFGSGLSMVAETEDMGSIDLTDDKGNEVRRPTNELVTNEVVVKKIEEMLVMGGLQVKLGPGSYLDLQGGLMTNSVKYTQQIKIHKSYKDLDNEPVEVDEVGDKKSLKLEIDKILLMANVTVLF